MRILFLGFGITPYYRDFLNKLNSIDGLSIDNIRPKGENKNLGKGVHQDFSGICFRDMELDEKEIPHRRFFGLADFEVRPEYRSYSGLEGFLYENRPNVIVVSVVYHQVFQYDKGIVRAVKKIGAKIVFHSIPFGLAKFQDRINNLPKRSRLKMESFPLLGKVVRSIGLDIVYMKWIRSRAMMRPIHDDQKIYCYPDAHAVYHEGGIEIYSSYGVSKEKIFVVRNSPNTGSLIEAFDRQPSLQHPPRLLHVGRLVAWKRVDLLIRSLAKLRAGHFPDLDLAIIGYGPCEDELRMLANELNVQDSVHFLGGIYASDELAEQASISSIYVLAGMGGLSINEAMCFKLPVICSRGDGTEKHLVREGINGLYFKEGDSDDLTKKIAALLSDDERRTLMGKRSRLIIESEMNTEIHVNNYLTLFEKLTGQNLSRYKKSKISPELVSH